jgi:tellurite resistance protein TehA-like permease
MATGILAITCRGLGLAAVSWFLLAIALVAYLVLAVLTAIRLLRHLPAVVRDLDDPGRSFGFFTFVAGSGVLSVALTQAGLDPPAAILGLTGVAAWVFLTYALPLRLMPARAPQAPLEWVSGSWLLWVVATQSVAGVLAVAAASGDPRLSRSLSVLAIMTWGIGVVLYIVLIGFIMMRLFLTQIDPIQFTPPYWINMGAASISVLSGALLLTLEHRDVLLGEVRPFVAGLSLVLWAWASWWIPALLLLWFWRHWLRKVPLVYEPSLWSLIFPLGMYGAASVELGRGLNQPWLLTVARLALPAAGAAWLWTFAAMLWSWRRRPLT